MLENVMSHFQPLSLSGPSLSATIILCIKLAKYYPRGHHDSPRIALYRLLATAKGPSGLCPKTWRSLTNTAMDSEIIAIMAYLVLVADV